MRRTHRGGMGGCATLAAPTFFERVPTLLKRVPTFFEAVFGGVRLGATAIFGVRRGYDAHIASLVRGSDGLP